MDRAYTSHDARPDALHYSLGPGSLSLSDQEIGFEIRNSKPGSTSMAILKGAKKNRVKIRKKETGVTCAAPPHVEVLKVHGRPSHGFPGLSQNAPRLIKGHY